MKHPLYFVKYSRIAPVVLAVTMLSASFPADAGAAASLSMVSARDHVEGSFTTARSVWADAGNIYLASQQGALFVLARDRAANFPIRSRIETGAPLTAVRGDGSFLYVTSTDGELRVYNKSTLALVSKISLASYGLNSVELDNGKIYVGAGQVTFDVDKSFVYLSSLNDGDVVYEVAKDSYAVTRTYGEQSIANSIGMFNKSNGALVRSFPNPKNIYGTPSQPELHINSGVLYATVPGCCGSGVSAINVSTGQTKTLPARYANTVAIKNGFTIVGSELGIAELYNRKSKHVDALELKSLTGYTGSEDIELRSLWADGKDNLVFAASSWGNDSSRNASLPSLFILEFAR
jgi:hypothetical protein